MALPFLYVPSVNKKKESLDCALDLFRPKEDALEPEEMDENFFYRHITTHFHPLFCDSSIVCVPHSKSIQGLVLTKDIIEAHCFQPSRFFRDQHVSTRQKQKSILFESPTTIITQSGYKEIRRVHILAEETVYVGRKKVIVYSIDQLLEGEVPAKYSYKPAIAIPPVRNTKNDLEFLNMFPENMEAIYELQLAVQEFIDTYVYIKGYNRTTVERIQHMYMKTYRTILQKNKLLQDSCRTPSEHDRFLELVENVVMSFLHKKIWIQTLRQLLESQDTYLDSICYTYFHVVLSQYSLRYPLSEMNVSCFHEAICNFQKMDKQAITPLEKLAVLRTTLDLISSAVYDYVEHFGHSTSDTSVTSDEMIPLLAFVIVQSRVSRKASLIYYMQHYRLARMIEGSVYSFVLATMKAACEFLKDDPLSLYDLNATQRARSISFQHIPKNDLLQHRKTQSADFQKETMGTTHILRPHMVLPHPSSDRKSIEIPNHWAVYHSSSSSPTSANQRPQKQTLGSSRPMFSTTVPSLSAPTSPTRSLSASPSMKKQPPQIIHVPERISFSHKRPTSMTDSRRHSEDCTETQDEGLGDFLNSLSQLEGNVVGERNGSIKSFNRIPPF